MKKIILLILCVAMVMGVTLASVNNALASPNQDPPQNKYGDRFEHPPETPWGPVHCLYDHCRKP